MNILDENIPKSQRELLVGWRIKVQQIGVNIGRKECSTRKSFHCCKHCVARRFSPAMKTFTNATFVLRSIVSFI
jgi:hypothetical protein